MPLLKRHHFDKVLEWAQKGRIAPLYLLVGDEEIGEDLKRRLLHLLRELGHFVEEINLAETPLEALLSSLRSPALLGRKIIELKGGEKLLSSPESEEAIRILESRKQNLTLVFVVSEVPEEHPWALFAREAGVLLALPQRRAGDLLRYEIPEILASFGKKMDRSTAEFLLSLVGEDLTLLRQEIEKLALYVGDSPVISREEVQELVSPRPEEAPYTVLEILFSQGAEKALEVSRELLARGTHPLVLVATFLTFFKRLWLFKELLEKTDLKEAKDYPSFRQKFFQAKKEFWADRVPRALAKTHPYALYRMLSAARRFRIGDFPLIFGALTKLDEALKTGTAAEEAFYSFFLSLRSLPSPNDRGGKSSFGAVLPGL